MNIKFDPACPIEIRGIVEPYLATFYPLISRCVDNFVVEFIPETSEFSEPFEAAILIRREYKTARLFVSSEYLVLDKKERKLAIAHELAHIITASLRTETRRVVEIWVPEETVEYVKGVFDNAEETLVDDLSKLMVECLTTKENLDTLYHTSEMAPIEHH